MGEVTILVINIGSSSIKFSLYEMPSERVITNGVVDRIGLENASIRLIGANGKRWEEKTWINNHKKAVELIIRKLTHVKYGLKESMSSIKTVGFRVVYGGEKFLESVEIDDSVIEFLCENKELAPLHIPPTIKGIEAFRALLPDTPMVAVFDTAFHQTMPTKAYLYSIPYRFYLSYRIRRYGFHGSSHQYAAQATAKLLNMPLRDLKIVSCHLGNGSSITAVMNGESIDTSMGFTPIAGVPMGTRCGDIDVSIIGYLMDKEKMSFESVVRLLNEESGFLGITGRTSDYKQIEMHAKAGGQRDRMIIDMFCYSIKKYIGAYAAAMNGLDCIILTGGIGENSADIRQLICEDMDYLGVSICSRRNAAGGEADMIVSTDESKVWIVRVKSNEELMLAKEAMMVTNQMED